MATANARHAGTGPFAQAWRAFRGWRRGRPFWGGLLVIVSGFEFYVTAHLDLTPVHIQFGPEGFLVWVIPLMLLLSGVLLWVSPAQRVFYGIIAAAVAVYGLIGLNLGGFFAGMLLGMVGGALGAAWAPVRPDAVAPTADPPTAESVPPERGDDGTYDDGTHPATDGESYPSTMDTGDSTVPLAPLGAEGAPAAMGPAAMDSAAMEPAERVFPPFREWTEDRPGATGSATESAGSSPASAVPPGDEPGPTVNHRRPGYDARLLAVALICLTTAAVGAVILHSPAPAAAAPCPPYSYSPTPPDTSTSAAPAKAGSAGNQNRSGGTPAPTRTPAGGSGAGGSGQGNPGPSRSPSPSPTAVAAQGGGGGLGGVVSGLLGDVGKLLGIPGAGSAPTPAAQAVPAPAPAAPAANGATKAGSTGAGTAGKGGTVRNNAAGVPRPAVTGTTSPSPAASPSSACPTLGPPINRHVPPPAGQPDVAEQPSLQKAAVLSQSGLSFDGVVNLPTKKGSVAVLEFSMDSSTSTPFELDVAGPGGHTLALTSSQLTVSGRVTFFTTKIQGNLLGLIPVTFTPDAPPPLVTPELFFTDATVELVFVHCDKLTAPNLVTEYIS